MITRFAAFAEKRDLKSKLSFLDFAKDRATLDFDGVT
jgi:hypothetical protein